MGISESSPSAPLDYLQEPAVEAFFDAREHEAYYLSLKNVDARRGFHDRLIVALGRVRS